MTRSVLYRDHRYLTHFQPQIDPWMNLLHLRWQIAVNSSVGFIDGIWRQTKDSFVIAGSIIESVSFRIVLVIPPSAPPWNNVVTTEWRLIWWSFFLSGFEWYGNGGLDFRSHVGRHFITVRCISFLFLMALAPTEGGGRREGWNIQHPKSSGVGME